MIRFLILLFGFCCGLTDVRISADPLPGSGGLAQELLSEAPLEIDVWVRQDPRATLAFLQERLPRLQEPAERIFWLKEIARAARFGGLFPLGLEAITEAIELAEAMGDPATILQVRREKAVLFHLNGQPEAAHSMISLTMRLADFYEMPAITAGLLNLRGVLRWQSGDLHSAARDLQEGIAILEGLNIPHDLASMNNNLGIVFFHMRQLDRALEHYEIALAIKEGEEIEDVVFLAAVLSNMGEVFTAQGKLEKALEVTYRSLQMEQRIGNPANIALSMYNLGEAYSKLGDLEQSFNYFKKALAIQIEHNFEWEMSGTLHRLAADSLALERLEEAARFLQDGLLMAFRVEADVLIRDFYELFVRYFRLKDDARLVRHFEREHQRMKALTSDQGLEEWSYLQQIQRRQVLASFPSPDNPAANAFAAEGVHAMMVDDVHWLDRTIAVAFLLILLLIIAVLLANNFRLTKLLNEARLQLLQKY